MSDKVPDWIRAEVYECFGGWSAYDHMRSRITAALLSSYRRGVEERDAEAKRREQELNLELGGVRRSWRDEQTKSKSAYRRGVEDSAKVADEWEPIETLLPMADDAANEAAHTGQYEAGERIASAIRRLGEVE